MKSLKMMEVLASGVADAVCVSPFLLPSRRRPFFFFFSSLHACRYPFRGLHKLRDVCNVNPPQARAGVGGVAAGVRLGESAPLLPPFIASLSFW